MNIHGTHHAEDLMPDSLEETSKYGNASMGRNQSGIATDPENILVEISPRSEKSRNKKSMASRT